MAGASSGLPIFVLAFYEDSENISYYNTKPLLLGCILYAAGALIYLSAYPERWKPKKFDIIGASHQIFHVCVLMAAWTHFSSNVVLYEKRKEHVCPVGF